MNTTFAVQASPYQSYFGKDRRVNTGPVTVVPSGDRQRSPTVKYLEDLATRTDLAPAVRKVAEMTAKCKGKGPEDVPLALEKELYYLTIQLIKTEAKVGRTTLVFVAGLVDITELMERLEGVPKCKSYALHAHMLREEQVGP